MQDKFTFGAIRWDAWYASLYENDPAFQVQRSLSPAEFHFRAPFFCDITEDNKLNIAHYDQDTFDKEAEYAVNAGIDYFTYVWYSPETINKGLTLARTFHLASKYKKQIKLCACLDSNAICKDFARKELMELFKTDVYKKVLDNRPLLYFFGLSREYEGIKRDIEFYTEECKKQGIPKPYFAIMDFNAQEAKDAGADAITSYCVFGTDGMSFDALHQKAQDEWKSKLEDSNKLGLSVIPTATSGWSNLPRHKNPVSWIQDDLSHSYAQYATKEDIFKQVAAVKEFVKNACTPVNSAIIYAWNEHDEGGWICPTLKVDENGNQLYDENGNKLINTERIDAVREALAL